MNNCIRIIGGRWRGKKIFFPDAAGLRPTSDRIKETLFNWLMHDIKGARCLDAFAGSGALGFEALSRGAQHVVMVEKSLAVYQNLQKISAQFMPKNLEIVHGDALNYAKQTKHAFDIVFLDPPFAQSEYYFQIINLLVSRQLMQPSGLLYLEASYDIQLDSETWHCTHSKQTGNVYYSLYRILIKS